MKLLIGLLLLIPALVSAETQTTYYSVKYGDKIVKEIVADSQGNVFRLGRRVDLTAPVTESEMSEAYDQTFASVNPDTQQFANSEFDFAEFIRKLESLYYRGAGSDPSVATGNYSGPYTKDNKWVTFGFKIGEPLDVRISRYNSTPGYSYLLVCGRLRHYVAQGNPMDGSQQYCRVGIGYYRVLRVSN